MMFDFGLFDVAYYVPLAAWIIVFNGTSEPYLYYEWRRGEDRLQKVAA